MFEYDAKVHRVIDGDTVILDVDLGFSTFIREPFRILGINAPELGTEAGTAALVHLEFLLRGTLRITTTKTSGGNEHKTFCRYLAKIKTEDGRDVSTVIAEAGYAEVYPS